MIASIENVLDSTLHIRHVNFRPHVLHEMKGLLDNSCPLHRRMETQVPGSEALQQQPSAYMGTPPPPTNVLERIPEDSATHDAALSPQDLFPGECKLLCYIAFVLMTFGSAETGRAGVRKDSMHAAAADEVASCAVLHVDQGRPDDFALQYELLLVILNGGYAILQGRQGQLCWGTCLASSIREACQELGSRHRPLKT